MGGNELGSSPVMKYLSILGTGGKELGCPPKIIGFSMISGTGGNELGSPPVIICRSFKI